MTRGRWKRLFAVALCGACALLSEQARSAPAGEGGDATEEARALMIDGNADLHAGKPAAALEKLERSFSLVPSPNTELLVARALRDLGRRVDAVRAFEHAEAEARRRSLAGEVKYSQTELAARAEGGSLRAQLGTLRVHVARPAQSSLFVDGKRVALADDGAASLMHEPGRVEVVVREGASEQKQIVTVTAGGTVQMEFAGIAPGTARSDVTPPPAPTPVETSARSWAVPAALVTGAVTLGGAGVFTFFGLRSEATWDDLSQRCGPTFCGPADRADADRAKTDQTIANVGLTVASIAAVATIAFVVVSLTAPRRSSTASSTASFTAPLDRPALPVVPRLSRTDRL